jgi:hypothetical protein
MITMSALPRLLNCDGALVLPRAELESEWADLGNDEHEDLARQVVGGTLPPRLSRIAPPHARVEVTVAYDAATGAGRIVGDKEGRDYTGFGPYEIPGKIDVVWIDEDTVVIVDWKTGHKEVDPAERNWQLWGYALAVCRALSKSKARIYIAYTNQPGQPIDEHTLDAMDLADFAARLKQLQVREAELRQRYKAGEQPTTREGTWCRYCASKSRCPSKTGLLVQVAERGLAVIGDTQLTRERAREAHFEIERIDQLLKEAKARREKWIDENGPIDLGDGRAFGRVPRRGNRVLDGDKAVQAIREIVGESAREFEALAVERKTSQAAIERAAKLLGVGQSPKKLKEQIVKRLEELGGVSYGRDTMPLGEFALEAGHEAPRLDHDEIDRLMKESA